MMKKFSANHIKVPARRGRGTTQLLRSRKKQLLRSWTVFRKTCFTVFSKKEHLVRSRKTASKMFLDGPFPYEKF